MSSAVALTMSATTANAQSTAETSQSRVARCIPRTIEVGRTGMEAMTRAHRRAVCEGGAAWLALRVRSARVVSRTPAAGEASTPFSTGPVAPRLLHGCRRGGERERAALGVAADRPALAGVDDRAAQLGNARQRRLHSLDGEVRERRGVAGPGPRAWTPRRRPSASASQPEPARRRGESSTPSTPCQNCRARAGSSAGNSISGAGMVVEGRAPPALPTAPRRASAPGLPLVQHRSAWTTRRSRVLVALGLVDPLGELLAVRERQPVERAFASGSAVSASASAAGTHRPRAAPCRARAATSTGRPPRRRPPAARPGSDPPGTRRPSRRLEVRHVYPLMTRRRGSASRPPRPSATCSSSSTTAAAGPRGTSVAVRRMEPTRRFSHARTGLPRAASRGHGHRRWRTPERRAEVIAAIDPGARAQRKRTGWRTASRKRSSGLRLRCVFMA